MKGEVTQQHERFRDRLVLSENMEFSDIDPRPLKKRRFFFEDDTVTQPNNPQPTHLDASTSSTTTTTDSSTLITQNSQISKPPGLVGGEDEESGQDGFDCELFANVVGQGLSDQVVQQIRVAADGDMERAINIYLDGSWKSNDQNGAHASSTNSIFRPDDHENARNITSSAKVAKGFTSRYVGSFGVAAWATRSGIGIVKHAEKVNIDRPKLQPTLKRGRGGKPVARASNQKGDVITRFTNNNGEEIGRLPRETAAWVSTLLDQHICKFEGFCVFAPDRVRVNDTIYLQLRCYMLAEAFKESSLSELGDDNRTPRLFEEQETEEEKALRLRQIALVKLFDEIGLSPTSLNETSARHKKEGLLQAAETPDHQAKNGSTQAKDASDSEDNDGEKLEQDQLDTLYKKAQAFDFNTPEAEPSPNLVMELRKYQKQALHWMISKEKDTNLNRESSMNPLWEEYTWPDRDPDDNLLPHVNDGNKFYINPYSGELSLKFPVQEQNCLGGILADEMGLGKTIEMMSLVHSHKAEVDKQQPKILPAKFTLGGPVNDLENTPAPFTTLVIAPTSLLSQWESEATKSSTEGTMKVFIYYGTDKDVDLRHLCSPANASSAPNLIITSYGVVRSEFASLTSGRFGSSSRGGLFSVEFFRIILDEAHHIKNRASKTARSCYDLKGTHRWVLTGTPIVNRLEDLFSLVRFLKVEPWNNFSFWKTFITVPFESKDVVRALNVVQTVLEPLVLRRTKSMKTPEGDSLVPLPPRIVKVEEVELSDQEREIYDHIFTRVKRTFNDNVAAGTLLKSYTTIFAQLLRLRQTCCHPVLTRNQSIVAEEEDAAVLANDTNGFKDDMDLQDLIKRFTESLDQADANQQDSTSRFTAHALRQIQSESSGECPICTEEPMIQPAVTSCWHSACKTCLEDYVRHQTDKGQPPRCFSCRENLSSRDIFEVVRHKSPVQSPSDGIADSNVALSSPTPRISLRRINPLSPSAHTSSKIHALMSHLTNLPPNTKSVVFSQFTSFLDLISPQLARAGIKHLRFDGSMSHKERAAVLTQFNSFEIEDEEDESSDASKKVQSKLSSRTADNQQNVLLISLRAGGVGLNLTAANHVFVMDPWWSFAVEAQAIDRVHRMGQTRDVSVTRFIAKNSIEGRMLRIQERKMMIAGSLGLRVGGDGGEDERRKERIEELKLLFE